MENADNRGAGSYAAPQAEQSAADRYSAATTDAADSSAGSAHGYQPGNTGYTPGATGYSPPGVSAYETTAPPNVVATPKGDPYYRPGSTSDYLPRGSSQPATSPATGADRYGAPPAAEWPSGF